LKDENVKLKFNKIRKKAYAQILNCINSYCARTMTAIEYQKHKAEETAVVDSV